MLTCSDAHSKDTGTDGPVTCAALVFSLCSVTFCRLQLTLFILKKMFYCEVCYFHGLSLGKVHTLNSRGGRLELHFDGIFAQ